MIEYYNLKHDLSLELGMDKKYSRQQLDLVIKNALISSEFVIKNQSYVSNSQECIDVFIDGVEYKLYVILKNITGAGWENKPKIKRVQVSNIKDIDNNISLNGNQNVFYLILGYYNYDNNPIFVAWDAYRYINHNTVRSCYVSVDSLKIGYVNEYYVGVDSAQKIWIFKIDYFRRFVLEYLDYVRKLSR